MGTGTRILGVVLCLLSTTALASPQGLEKAGDNSASITVAELRDHIFFLASDELRGRDTGTEDYLIAAHYAASQFREAGLVPIFEGKDGLKVYLQDVPLERRKINEGTRLMVHSEAGQREYAIGDDFLLPEMSMARTFGPGEKPLIFLGYGIHEPEAGWDDYKDFDVKGRTVLILFGSPKGKDGPVLPKEKHDLYANITRGAFKKLTDAIKLGASAVILISNDQFTPIWGVVKSQLNAESIAYAGDEQPQRTLSGNLLLITQDVAQALFAGEALDPVEFEKRGGLEGYRCFELQKAKLALDVQYDSTPLSSPNVIALVEGTDPELKDQVITVGAHLDHIGVNGGQVFNGADDNASGSAAVLEIAEAVAMDPPRRPVVFILYAAEEKGLYGSFHFAGHCPVGGENLMVNINLDMVGRYDPRIEANKYLYALGSAKIDPKLKDILVAVNERSANLNLDFSLDDNDPEFWFERSDHIHYHRMGVPTIALSNCEHEDYHRPSDDAEKIEYENLSKISQLVYGLVMELGNRDELLARAQ